MAFLRWALPIVPAVLLLGFASGRLSNANDGNWWYATLQRPAIMPPGWAFGTAWSLLYLLTGIALALVVAARGARLRGAAIALFIVQFVLNLAWSPLFFGAHQISLALILILIMIVVAAATVWAFFRVRTLAGALMVPYLAWLLFAAFLNYEIGRLNPDAESLAPGGSRTQISL